MSTPEGKVKAKVKRALKQLQAETTGICLAHRFRVWSFMPVQMGYGAPALDFLLCINRRFIAIETKVPGKGLTPRQVQTAEAIKAAGGIVYVVFDDRSLANAIKDIRKECRS